MTHQIIDNFLLEDSFKKLQNYIIWSNFFPWNLHTKISGEEEEIGTFYGTHKAYDNGKPISPLYEIMIPIINSLPNFRALMRIKANFYPKTHDIYEHGKHVDYKCEHKGAILSLNTCDGFTRLEDNTKIESIANRMLFFDSSKLHNSSTTTDEKGRFNININYL